MKEEVERTKFKIFLISSCDVIVIFIIIVISHCDIIMVR